MVKAIADRFGPAPKKARPEGQAPGVKAYEKSFAIVASDPEQASEEIQILRLGPARPPTTTESQLRDDLVLRLGESAFNRRLEGKLARGGTSWLSGRVSAGTEGAILWSADLTGRAAAGKWKAALQELALELQRRRAFGFTAREPADVQKQMIRPPNAP